MTSKLWDRLGASAPIFNIYSPIHGTWTDPDISSLTIHLGSAMAGISTSTADVTVVKELPRAASSNQGVIITLTPYGQSLLSGLTGRPSEQLRPRFFGRLAGQEVTDPGDNRIRTTKVTCQDWLALIAQLDKGGWVERANPNLWSLYRSLFLRASIPGTSLLEAWGSNWHWVRWPPEEDDADTKVISTSDVSGKFAADVGNLIRMRRSGQPQGLAHDHLVTMADGWRTFGERPLQRSQVLSPVSWSQASTIPIRISWDQWLNPGSTTIQTWSIGVGDDSYVTKGEHMDMTHIWVIGGETGLADAMTARVSAAAADTYSVRQVTVDLLQLLRPDSKGGTAADRAQAGQLLVKEHGDPIALGVDWPARASGIYFVESLTETITPDSWRMELELVPANHVTGRPRPADIYGDSWDTAYPRNTVWDTPSTIWEESP